jgi:hypothetical protein
MAFGILRASEKMRRLLSPCTRGRSEPGTSRTCRVAFAAWMLITVSITNPSQSRFATRRYFDHNDSVTVRICSD